MEVHWKGEGGLSFRGGVHWEGEGDFSFGVSTGRGMENGRLFSSQLRVKVE